MISGRKLKSVNSVKNAISNKYKNRTTIAGLVKSKHEDAVIVQAAFICGKLKTIKKKLKSKLESELADAVSMGEADMGVLQ